MAYTTHKLPRPAPFPLPSSYSPLKKHQRHPQQQASSLGMHRYTATALRCVGLGWAESGWVELLRMFEESELNPNSVTSQIARLPEPQPNSKCDSTASFGGRSVSLLYISISRWLHIERHNMLCTSKRAKGRKGRESKHNALDVFLPRHNTAMEKHSQKLAVGLAYQGPPHSKSTNSSQTEESTSQQQQYSFSTPLPSPLPSSFILLGRQITTTDPARKWLVQHLRPARERGRERERALYDHIVSVLPC